MSAFEAEHLGERLGHEAMQASPTRRTPTRSMPIIDPLYGSIHVARWAEILLRTQAFQRLGGISLSDVPGELLFGRPFPTRLDHVRGVYHLARLARPRDRMLQAAALAHDLGHGPFSHLTEPLMREYLGVDHEQRAAQLLEQVHAELTPAEARTLRWLRWDEIVSLIRGESANRAGALLNGWLDYDNADNVARFLLGSGLATPGYDPRILARALCVLPTPSSPPGCDDEPTSKEMPNRISSASSAEGARPVASTCLLAEAQDAAIAWSADRAALYAYLHEGHDNLAAHSMLRKAYDLAAEAGMVTRAFFDLTDAQALSLASQGRSRGAAFLVKQVLNRRFYACVYEATLPDNVGDALPRQTWRRRLSAEAYLAHEAGLLPQDVLIEALVSSAARPLPPIAMNAARSALRWLAAGTAAPCTLHLFVAPNVPLDYARRLRMAAARTFEPIGAVSRTVTEHGDLLRQAQTVEEA